MIRVKNVTKSFGQRTLWENASFTVQKGEMLALTGPSGCGKSTLLNCLGLLEEVDHGEIFIDGKDVTKSRAGARRRFRRDKVGYLFQNYALIENANMYHNLAVAVGGRPGRFLKRDIFEAALHDVGLGGRGNEMVFQLSGGEQQRLALARLLVKEPAVVLADEPTGALDEENSAMVIAHLRKMAEAGCAVIIATHSKLVEKGCDSTLSLGKDVIGGDNLVMSLGPDSVSSLSC
ncbi:ATP-binding cassette domain-containing protein [Streptomyces sp. NPDC048664]|uniref:ATP-binding cassette domain-containing protein n=1 Tax=Streptomyces sp. NPDC048664 TaxID=3154505 RepID=UPI0034381852